MSIPKTFPSGPALASFLLLTGLSSCGKDYCDQAVGTMGSRVDSLRIPLRLLSRPGDSFLVESGPAPLSVRWRVLEEGSENTGGGFVPWLRERGQHDFTVQQGTAASVDFRMLLDSINPYLDDPTRGVVSGVLRGEAQSPSGSFQRRLFGSIEASLPMDAKIREGVPFSFVVRLRDTSGIVLVLRDSANQKMSPYSCGVGGF